MLASFVLVLGLVWWARLRFQRRHLAWLVTRANGDPRKATRITLVPQICALLLACVTLAVAVVSEQVFGLFWVRIPLAILVLALYVPYAAMLAPRRRVPKLRRTPVERMVDLGASEQVAAQIARAGKPFAIAGTLVMLTAVYVLFWHPIAG